MNTYLGDGVYATDEANPGHITLSTGTHIVDASANVIHLDPNVLEALIDFDSKQRLAERDRRAALIINRIPEDLRYKAEIYSSTQIDINSLEHDEALSVMKALNAGRWERKESGIGGKLDYIAQIDGWTVRLWAAGPPDSCRVVEEEYEIPAVPASTGKRKRVICAKGVSETPPIPEPDPSTAWPDSYHAE
jgi:hypothetical protein